MPLRQADRLFYIIRILRAASPLADQLGALAEKSRLGKSRSGECGLDLQKSRRSPRPWFSSISTDTLDKIRFDVSCLTPIRPPP